METEPHMIDKTYLSAVLETLELISHITSQLHSTHQTPKTIDFLSQIQAKAHSKLSLPDLQPSSIKYWEGVRDMANLSSKKWSELNDSTGFLSFLHSTRAKLVVKNGLTSTSKPSIEPVPAPRLIQPKPIPTNTPVIKTLDKLSALDEALQTSGIGTSSSTKFSSLSDMLLAKEDGGEKSDEEDDMLSLSRDRPPTPFVYYHPYPKPPPATSAEAHLKPTKKSVVDDSAGDDDSPLIQELKDLPVFKDFLGIDQEKK